MKLYPSLERSFLKSIYMYIEPEISKIFPIRSFCEYFYWCFWKEVPYV